MSARISRKGIHEVDLGENDKEGDNEDDSRKHLRYEHERGKRGASDRLFPHKSVGGRRGDKECADATLPC